MHFSNARQFSFVCSSARTMHPPWGVRADGPTRSRKHLHPGENTARSFLVTHGVLEHCFDGDERADEADALGVVEERFAVSLGDPDASRCGARGTNTRMRGLRKRRSWRQRNRGRRKIESSETAKTKE